MTNKEKQEWLEVKYPLTIIPDRYDGTYSGASWLAFPLYCDEIPPAVDGYDEACAAFWKDYSEPVGKGNSAQSAIDDLIKQMYEFKPEESEDERIRNEILIYIGAKQDIDLETHNRWCTYLEKQKEQKPVEWSETKELVFKDICNHLEAEGYGGWVVLLNALHNGEFQTKVEWSEEDERVIRDACNWISEYAGFLMSENKDKAEMLWKLSEKLKSLRPQPHWKPSEEQMEAIKHAYNSFPDYCPTKLGLKSLYEHLKKL